MSAPMPMTEQRLAEIEARTDAATPGPWEWRAGWKDEPVDYETFESPGYYENPELHGPGQDEHILSCGEYDIVSGEKPKQIANSRFIANAREDVPALLAEVKRLRAKLPEGA